ncbi:gamma-glutamyltranspeptidase 1 [Tanacetum coccineum]
MRMAHESGAGDEDYVQREMIHYEIDTGIPFKLRHCWEILKDRPKWQEIALPKFSTGSGGSKRHKSSGSSSFNTESREASINLNTNVGDNDEDEMQEVQRLEGKDKARAVRKKKGSKGSGSSNVNEDALARLMVTEMTTQEKTERLAFLEIKMREVEYREREIEQQDMRRVVVAAMFVLGTGRCCYMFRTVPKVYRDDKICITEFGEVGDGKMLNTIAFTKAIHRIWTFEKDVLNFVASFLLMKLSGAIYEETERYVCKLREAHGIAISVDGADCDGNDRGKECVICLSSEPGFCYTGYGCTR